jgi:hypothetical protein
MNRKWKQYLSLPPIQKLAVVLRAGMLLMELTLRTKNQQYLAFYLAQNQPYEGLPVMAALPHARAEPFPTPRGRCSLPPSINGGWEGEEARSRWGR